MTAAVMTADELAKALAAISSLAIVASTLPAAAVLEHLAGERGQIPPRPFEVLTDIVEACVLLGELGDELSRIVNDAADGRAS